MEEEFNKAWNALRVVLREAFSFNDIKDIAGLAGLDVTRLAQLNQQASGGATKGQLISAFDQQVGQLEHREKAQVLNRLAEEIVSQRPNEIEKLKGYLDRLGWQLADGRLIPIELIDVDELAELPPAAKTDLVKAAARLRDGDMDGALAAACAAVDSATSAIFQEKQLDSMKGKGFQTRFAKALEANKVIETITADLVDVGWSKADANTFAKNLKGSLNQGAYVMQELRSGMSDVHGSKSVVPALVFDSSKWASLMVRVLK